MAKPIAPAYVEVFQRAEKQYMCTNEPMVV